MKKTLFFFIADSQLMLIVGIDTNIFFVSGFLYNSFTMIENRGRKLSKAWQRTTSPTAFGFLPLLDIM